VSDLHWTEVDGVQVVWTETAAPVRSGLLFRAGRADESLLTAGHTHLIEHMAFSSLDDPTRRHNGFVGGIVTGFVTIGSVEELPAFISGICRGLTALPDDLLETEKQILAAESARRSYDPIGNLLSWRYGAVGYGLLGMREMGTSIATMTQLRERAARMFTRGNAVLWLTGPPPSDLRFELPDGVKVPIQPLTELPRPSPSWFVDNGSGGVAAAGMVPRVPASTLFCEIASRRMADHLRTEKGLSYAPGVTYDHLTADTAHLILHADSPKERHKELAEAFGEVFGGLEQIDEHEVDVARDQVAERMTGILAPPPDDVALGDVQRAAMDWIFGRGFESIDQLAAETSAVTADDVSAFFAALKSTVMFAVPSGVSVRPWMGTRAAISTRAAVQGQEVASMDAPVRRERLVHGAEGVSVRWSDGTHNTVRYSEIAAALRYEDGGLCLVGLDGGSVTIEPTLWREGRKIALEIGTRVPEHVMVDRGERHSREIPKPTATNWQKSKAMRMTMMGSGLVTAGAVAALSVVFRLGPVVYNTPGDGTLDAEIPGFILIVLLMAAGLMMGLGVRFLRGARK
jgi:zinc protease